MRLTNREIYQYAQELWDKANNPHDTPAAFRRRYEDARLTWLRLKAKDFEVTEMNREDLRPFIREQNFASTREVILDESLKIFRITALLGDFTFECSGKRTVRTLPIKPRSIDAIGASLTDAWNIPDDTEPAYYERWRNGGNVLEILSTSTPDNVVLHWIKEPDRYNLDTDQGGFTEEGREQQQEIILMAVKGYELQIENYQRFQGTAQQIQSAGF